MKRVATLLVILSLIGCSASRTSPPSMVITHNEEGGTLQGLVTLGGASLPGATVTIALDATTTLSAVSDVNGRYRFANLAAGIYTVKVEMQSMQTMTQRVPVSAIRGASLLTDMKLTSVSEAITVTSAAPSVLANGSIGFTASAPMPGAVSAEYGRYPGGVVQNAEMHAQAEPYVSVPEHGYLSAAKQNVTTFSIDVDRASYTNVRQFLTANQRPPADAVRVEEMINYFTYRLPQPAGAEPFSITSEVSGCPWNLNHRLLRVGIQGRNLEEWKMAPNNLVFLLDVSGSMDSPERLPLLKRAFGELVARLRAEDSVAIVVYAGAAGLVLPPTSGADKPVILAALERLQAGGSTAGAEGIELAYKTALDNFKPNGNNRVILATDGDFNVGISSLGDLQKFIEEKRKSGVFLTTLGVGTGNYRDSILELLADKGNGNYSYLDRYEEAKKVFGQELAGTLVTIAKDVKVQLAFDASRVKEYRQIGYENRALENKDFEDDTKDAGELGAGHTVTVLYEIVPQDGAANTGAVASVKLRYKAPNGEKSQEIQAQAIDEGKSAYDASPDMQFAAAVAELGMILRNSPNRGTATIAEVLQLAKLAQGEDLDGLRGDFLKMVQQAQGLIDSANVVTAATKP